MAQRVTLRKRQPYNTTSNRRRVVKTPGGKLVYHHIKKIASSPKCGDCGIGLPGVSFACFVRFDFTHPYLERSLPFVRDNMQQSQNARKQSAGHMAARDAETA